MYHASREVIGTGQCVRDVSCVTRVIAMHLGAQGGATAEDDLNVDAAAQERPFPLIQ